MAPSWLFIFNEKLAIDRHLTRSIFPHIELDRNKHYSLGLVYLSSFNTIPNVTAANNYINVRFDIRKGYEDNSIPLDEVPNDQQISHWFEIRVPEGVYDLDRLCQVLTNLLRRTLMRWNEKHYKNLEGELVEVEFNSTTNRIMIIDINKICQFDFTKENSVGSLLGFDKRRELTNWTDNHAFKFHHHLADKEPSIHPFYTINVFCNLVEQSYFNGRENHILYSFPYQIKPGQHIHEYPREIVYLPINTRSIKEISLSLRDEFGRQVILPDTRIVITLRLIEE